MNEKEAGVGTALGVGAMGAGALLLASLGAKQIQDAPSRQVDWGKILNTGVASTGVGMSAASLVNLIHAIKEQRRKNDEGDLEEASNDKAIVIDLPAKEAEAKSKTKPTLKEMKATTGKGQARCMDGEFGSGVITPQVKKAQNVPNVQEIESPSTVQNEMTAVTMPIQVVVGAGMLAGGYYMADALYAKYRKKQLSEKLKASQQNYVQSLLNKSAQAKASGPKMDVLDMLLAGGMLSAIVTGGASGYITKRYLDKRYDEAQTKGYEPPRIPSIVVRSRPSKKKEEETGEAVKAAFYAIYDYLSDDKPITKEAAIKDPATLHKFVEHAELGEMVELMEKYAELREPLLRAGDIVMIKKLGQFDVIGEIKDKLEDAIGDAVGDGSLMPIDDSSHPPLEESDLPALIETSKDDKAAQRYVRKNKQRILNALNKAFRTKRDFTAQPTTQV